MNIVILWGRDILRIRVRVFHYQGKPAAIAEEKTPFTQIRETQVFDGIDDHGTIINPGDPGRYRFFFCGGRAAPHTFFQE